jgi:hypothetical protein
MKKPTLEQVESVRAVALAMSALTEVWDENFNRVYEELGEEVTELLLTCSFDSMSWAWFQFSHAVADLTNSNRVVN